MAVRFNPETGHMGIVGTDAGTTKVMSPRKVYETFSGAAGERLMSDIAQDCLNRGQRVPLAIKAIRSVKDTETQELERSLHSAEYLRKIRLQREKQAGRISEAEFQREISKGEIV